MFVGFLPQARITCRAMSSSEVWHFSTKSWTPRVVELHPYFRMLSTWFTNFSNSSESGGKPTSIAKSFDIIWQGMVVFIYISNEEQNKCKIGDWIYLTQAGRKTLCVSTVESNRHWICFLSDSFSRQSWAFRSCKNRQVCTNEAVRKTASDDDKDSLATNDSSDKDCVRWSIGVVQDPSTFYSPNQSQWCSLVKRYCTVFWRYLNDFE